MTRLIRFIRLSHFVHESCMTCGIKQIESRAGEDTAFISTPATWAVEVRIGRSGSIYHRFSYCTKHKDQFRREAAPRA